MNDLANIHRRPKVGVGVFVCRAMSFFLSGELLMGERKGSHGAGTWSIPGGLVEADEGVAGAARRELKEEADIDAETRALLVPASLRFFEKSEGPLAYVTLYALAHVSVTTEAKVMEPDKCEAWRWVSLGAGSTWPGPLFEPLQDLFTAIRVKSPYDLERFFRSFEPWDQDDLIRGMR